MKGLVSILFGVTLFIVLLITMGNRMDKYSQEPVSEQLKVGFQIARGCNYITYMKDKETNLCFAYSWCGGHNGGPAFTWVPDSACGN